MRQHYSQPFLEEERFAYKMDNFRINKFTNAKREH